MRIMGLDLGEKTIGVAVCDPLEFTAQGIKVIRRSKNEWDELTQLVGDYDIREIVLGYPKNMNGTLGERAIKTERFAKLLENKFEIPVKLWDERLTTVAAQRMLVEADVSRSKRKKVVDKIAAIIILQGYLDSR